MKRLLIIAAAVALAGGIIHSCLKSDAMTVSSPDGNINVGFHVSPEGEIYYTVASRGATVLDSSRLAIDARECRLGYNAAVKNVSRSSVDEQWTTVWGEESTIRNNYNEMRVELCENDSIGVEYAIVFRVFDDGVGFRYEITSQAAIDSITIIDERTEFALAEDAVAWSIPWDHEYYEHIYEPSIASRLDTVCTPVTMKMTDSLYLSIHEAALTDYASMNLHPCGGTCLKTYLTPWSSGEKVFTAAPMKSPWRTVIVASAAADLITSRMMLNLNDECALDDVSWIEPGRYIGIWWGMHRRNYTWEAGPDHGATTENTKRYIDFAAANGYSGVLVEGWNRGWDGDWSANGHLFSFTEAYPDFDIEEVCRYAAGKGVRLIGHHETGGAATNYENQLDSAFALYRRLGVNSVKTGYVNKLLDGRELHGSQYGVRHYRKVIETAARYGIMIDNHEPVMPTGLQRTYPNLMTQEGVRGQEYNGWSPDGGNPPEHTVTLPFTRGLAGPMDYTPGIFNFENKAVPGTRPQNTLAKELALSVVLYSPLQMSADMIENYENQPAFEFLTQCPVDWERTLVPEAKIGEYVTIARKERGGDRWFIGAITGCNAHEHCLKLDFLDDGADYVARVFADAGDADYRTNPMAMEIYDVPVDRHKILPLRMAPGGGAAVLISKR